MNNNQYYLGLDVGSTTVKAVLFSGAPRVEAQGDTQVEAQDGVIKGSPADESGKILWKRYERHETKQAEKTLQYLQELEKSFPDFFYAGNPNLEIYCTGSGGANLAGAIGAKQIQEVLSVSTAVERLFPDVYSVVELGGQDAKIILFKESAPGKPRKKIMTMNDKCAGGTGAVVDKIAGKLMLTQDDLKKLPYKGIKLHPVAGKCGVFAETDINSLQKSGVVPQELMASLFEALVQQNLTVLTRGNTLMPKVLLLGGPNTFIPALGDAWRENFKELWRERGVELPAGFSYDNLEDTIDQLIFAPENAELFAAMGAVMAGSGDELGGDAPRYHGSLRLKEYIEERSAQIRGAVETPSCMARPALVASKDGQEGGQVENQKSGLSEEVKQFKRDYMPPEWIAPLFEKGVHVEAILGLDGGSTSTKGVLLNLSGDVIASEYVLSKGNPIEDAMNVIAGLREHVEKNGATLEIVRAGVTGYAKEVLQEVFGADTAVVETVAHSKAALKYYPDAEVIVDVGGQDIKIIQLKDGRVKDFKLNTQCSAGNGYFLQNTAEGFGYNVNEYADIAFSAKKYPQFGYGCAVFLQTDIVDFQRQGWESPEILAGLADVLPKNIWQYVAKVPNISLMGSRFILQGGTQKNAAAVKSQVDYLKQKFEGTGIEPKITVHRFTSVCGAIGAALEAGSKKAGTQKGGDLKGAFTNRGAADSSMPLGEQGSQKGGRPQSSFIGLEASQSVVYESAHNESTRCYYCKNKCIRTFIDIQIKGSGEEEKRRRLIIAPCEKGEAEDSESMKEIKSRTDKMKSENPNLSHWASRHVWSSQKKSVARYAELIQRKKKGKGALLSRFGAITTKKAKGETEKFSAGPLLDKRKKDRGEITIGFPRAMNQYTLQPFFTGYFESLGFSYRNMRFSSFTSEKVYKEGSKRGTVDPCFPSKVVLAHVHNLLEKHKKKELDYIYFPIVNTYPTPMKNVIGNHACPTAAGSPEMAYSAFAKEEDIFSESGIVYLKPFLNLDSPLTAEDEMLKQTAIPMGISEEENRIAVRAGYRALRRYKHELQRRGRAIIEQVSREGRPAVVLLGRSYHDDPGINHGIMDQFQERGYPVLNIYSLPMDEEFIAPYFSDNEELHPLDIHDVWKNSFSASSSLKIWAAKFIARHPNLVPVELSSFKCGHDSMLYSTVEKIVEYSGTPYFSFKDIDENNPAGSIKIRVETIDYFLQDYAKGIVPVKKETAAL